MNTNPTDTTRITTRNYSAEREGVFPSLCWKAIFGGTVAAIGIHILLTTLGIGAGLPTFSPTTDANSVTHFSKHAAIIWSLCAVVALWFGGLVAGRFSHSVHGGFVHGILVWSLTLIITVLLLAMGTGMVLGGALKTVGMGMGITSGVAASGMAARDKQTSDQLTSFIDEAVQSVPTNAAPKATTRAKREVGFAVTKLFAPGNDANFASNRAALINVLVNTTQMSEADATKVVDDWTASYNELKAELEQKADAAARALTSAAIMSFFALLFGLIITGLGGTMGAHFALKHAAVRTELR